MLGIIMSGIIGCMCIHGFLKETNENSKSKQISIQNNDKYYLDAHGDTRRVDNNHKVITNIKDFENNDWIDKDLKTGEILNRRPTAEKERLQKWAIEAKEKNIKAKQEAIEKGEYYYSSWEITEHSKYRTIPYEYVERRTSDDLLVKVEGYDNQIIKDKKTDLMLVNNSIPFGNYDPIKSLKSHNHYVCTQGSYKKNNNLSEEEMIAYAKKIGALL